jgi:hypothetical protein
VTVRRPKLVEVDELRHGDRLLVARTRHVFVAKLLGANGEGIALDLEGDVLRVDAGQRNVDLPAVLALIDPERRRLCEGEGLRTSVMLTARRP